MIYFLLSINFINFIKYLLFYQTVFIFLFCIDFVYLLDDIFKQQQTLVNSITERDVFSS